jgi:type IV secretory pathway VirB10-like protein
VPFILPWAQIAVVIVALAVLAVMVTAVYLLGSERRRRKQAEAASKLDQEVRDVVDESDANPVVIDDKWLHQGEGGRPPPGGPVPPPSGPVPRRPGPPVK